MAQDEWIDRARYHLEGWAIWKRGNRGVVGHGFDSHSTILECGGSKHFDHMVQAEDSKAAAIADGIICDKSFPYLYRTAIESEYLLQGVIKSNRYGTAELLMDAQEAFWKKAKKWLV